ncbi:MAG: tetratricopeptide repeat protein [Candidatus Eisenbacteria bacterium]|uniref:Tetratricopeptide repeat protein n=1 Tax=Eiseniibacteriota bacterium TaxID=2212470 RepID=A0A538U9U2_UNCEI|nr:MAG: tetratricopeptide repeat protein [Candidatus Eisenbacteria bacterium]
MSRLRAGLAVAAVVLAAAGCGDPQLWARYRAERDFWRARRLVERIELNPRVARAAEFARAAAACRAVTTAFPAAAWATPERVGTPIAADVAAVSGQAAIARARLDELAGRTDAAIAGYARAEADYAALPPVALEAVLARAAALERAGRSAEATGAYAGIIGRFPLVDPVSGRSVLAAMDAPLRVAQDQTRAGQTAAADATLRAAEARYAAELERQDGRPPGFDLWVRMAQVRRMTGRTEAALEALRHAMGQPGASRPAMVVRLAETCVEGGLPDSALVYAAWAERGFEPVRPRALVLAARAWELKGPPDSAIVAWGRYLDAYPTAVDTSSLARFQRGRLYEDLGRWPLARSEYRALIARDPTHALAFEAIRRIPAWHAAHGETAEARIEGRGALEDLDRLIGSHRDARVLQQARAARAQVLLAMGDWAAASTALGELWDHYGDTPVGADAAFQAAELNERQLHDVTKAVALYRELAEHAALDADRRRAQDQLARLGRGRG